MIRPVAWRIARAHIALGAVVGANNAVQSLAAGLTQAAGTLSAELARTIRELHRELPCNCSACAMKAAPSPSPASKQAN